MGEIKPAWPASILLKESAATLAGTSHVLDSGPATRSGSFTAENTGLRCSQKAEKYGPRASRTQSLRTWRPPRPTSRDLRFQRLAESATRRRRSVLSFH